MDVKRFADTKADEKVLKKADDYLAAMERVGKPVTRITLRKREYDDLAKRARSYAEEMKIEPPDSLSYRDLPLHRHDA